MPTDRNSERNDATGQRCAAAGRWAGRVLATALLATALLAPAMASGEPPALSGSAASGASSAVDPRASLSAEEARQVLQWAADWVRPILPEHYHGEQDWGKKLRVYAGVKVDFDGGRLKTKRRWKELGHGRWLRYDIRLRDPTDPGHLDIRITRAEQGEDRRIHFAAQIDSLLDLDVQQERWNLGTRLFSVSAKAAAKLRLTVAGDVGFALDLTQLPPDILADPKIVSTELVLIDLKVDRISKIGGDAAGIAGDLIERILRKEYLPRQQAAITTKLNRQIDRRRDQLRFGASQWTGRQSLSGRAE